MSSVKKSLLGLLFATLVSALAYVLIVNGIRNPMAGETAQYTATFDDVSGLRPGSDVRRYGVQVGKVKSIKVARAGDTNLAQVHLEIAKSQKVTTATHLTVKFQNLVGIRFIDISDDSTPNPQPVSQIPLGQTTGSFDITSIFQGLAPVFRTLEPADVNDLTDKLAVFLNGDGTGTADLMSSLSTIANKAADKQATLKTLVQNLAVTAQKAQGKTEKLFQVLTNVSNMVTSLSSIQDKFIELAQYGPNFAIAANRMTSLLRGDEKTDFNAKLDVMRANLYRVPEFFERLPGFYNGLKPIMDDPGSDFGCLNGTMAVPPNLKVFMGDQQVTLCRR
ncbi:Mce family protein [Mycobacteroides abscessus subsp. massiliense]|uniref:MlaD family protein n=1 Tax=Mycobacteroides abscessus TaxID=36809 RepID=UPI0009A80870|nr:MlaD family protein [Mycobacteroides abscessus]SKR01535.1 Mce family protein [Mycobacteroides abscessus subsp. massiliense]SKR64240.1 Mce family protein [Mycobacteroides abscessus subsp. massiliense]SKT48022.1 Mce family protein [Mycobacteroides abscessus subsp. massiliense]SKT85584.1 Mce family protein [Mycobacteroides abscessus subsp. massiliense]SLA27887.1 Mce family protein [Mycobacteroides abscessus subsp. massiliense]